MRYRATALIIRDSKILLVKDKDRHDYSMPGGGFQPKEQTLQAEIREVYEELKLRTFQATRLRYCDVIGKRANHKVCTLVVEGEPHINRSELDSFLWWDTKQDVPLQGHVKFIWNKYKSKNP